MGSIGQPASTLLPILDFEEQSSSQPIENCSTIPVFSSLNLHSMKVDAERQYQAETHSGAGRKRSRDEAGINLEDNDLIQQAAEISFGKGSKYDEGIILNEPDGFIFDNSNDKRLFTDDAGAFPLPVDPQSMSERPVLRSHKSQRLDLGTSSSKSEDVDGCGGYSPSSSPTRQSPINRGPTVDDFTMHLGIGWSRISSDEDMQAAARGWAKYIENHFQISHPKILLQSKGLASYLVEASEGWFLFGEDLTQGKLVATSLDRTFEHLRASPPVFDGVQVLVAFTEQTKPSMNALHEDMMDAPHIYVGSMNRRKEYLINSEMGLGGAGTQTINRQDPEDRMDMS